MRYLVLYELKRSWKRVLILYVLIILSVLFSNTLFDSNDRGNAIAFMLFCVGAMMILDVRITQLTKNLVFNERKHMLLIPKSITQIIGANALVTYMDCALLSGVLTYLFRYYGSGIMNFLLFMHLGFLAYIIFCYMYLLSAKILKRSLLTIGVSIIIGIIILTMWIFSVVSGNYSLLTLFIVRPEATVVFLGALGLWGMIIISAIISRSVSLKSREVRISGLCIGIMVITVAIMIITYINRNIDDVNVPIVLDEQAIGTWEAVDFVNEIEDFDPTVGKRKYSLREVKLVGWSQGADDNKALKGDVTYMRAEAVTREVKWTKDYIINFPLKDTLARYHIKEIEGRTYMFMEWKSGDYVFRHSKLPYYVFQKTVQ